MSKLEKVRKLASGQKIEGEIKVSTAKGKKFMIILKDGSKIHFGQQGYEDYLDHGDDKRRAAYRARATKIKDGSGNLTVNDKHSPNYYAVRLLW